MARSKNPGANGNKTPHGLAPPVALDADYAEHADAYYGRLITKRYKDKAPVTLPRISILEDYDENGNPRNQA